MVIVVAYDACLRLSEYFPFVCPSVRQVSGSVRGVNGYGAATVACQLGG